MKTVNHCPACGKPTTQEDYYWHDDTATPRKKNPNCKECVSKLQKQKYLAKKAEMELYGI